jgi:hypothetical protein
MYFWANVFWANVFQGKCLSGQTSYGQMSFWANVFWANVFWANVHLGKCLSGETSSGQMSSGQMSLWVNVSAQMSLGKCRTGKCRITLFYSLLLLKKGNNYLNQYLFSTHSYLATMCAAVTLA